MYQFLFSTFIVLYSLLIKKYLIEVQNPFILVKLISLVFDIIANTMLLCSQDFDFSFLLNICPNQRKILNIDIMLQYTSSFWLCVPSHLLRIQLYQKRVWHHPYVN